MDLKISVYGCEEISALLLKLPGELQDKYGARGLKAAAEITVMAVKSRMPSATGLAKESIGYSNVRFYRTSGVLFTAIEPRKGFKRIVTTNFARTGSATKTRIRSRRTSSVTADLGRVQDPRKYMHLIEGGRKAVAPTSAKALHSALDPQNRFFMHAASVAAHPVMGPARDAVAGAAKVAIEIELEKGIVEWNARNQTSPSA